MRLLVTYIKKKVKYLSHNKKQKKFQVDYN